MTVPTGIPCKVDWPETGTNAFFYQTNKERYAWSIDPTPGGETVFAGKTTHPQQPGNDLAVTGIDASGRWTWSCLVGGQAYDAARYIRRTSSGTLIVAGVTTSTGAGSADFWLVAIAAPQDISEKRTPVRLGSPGIPFLPRDRGGRKRP